MCSGDFTGFTKPYYRAFRVRSSQPIFQIEQLRLLERQGHSLLAREPGHEPKQSDPRAYIQQGPPEYQPGILQHLPLVAPIPACFPGPDFQPRCRENKTILLSRTVHRAPARPELQGRSTQSCSAPGAASPTGSAGIAPRAPEGRGAA